MVNSLSLEDRFSLEPVLLSNPFLENEIIYFIEDFGLSLQNTHLAECPPLPCVYSDTDIVKLISRRKSYKTPRIIKRGSIVCTRPRASLCENVEQLTLNLFDE